MRARFCPPPRPLEASGRTRPAGGHALGKGVPSPAIPSVSGLVHGLRTHSRRRRAPCVVSGYRVTPRARARRTVRTSQQLCEASHYVGERVGRAWVGLGGRVGAQGWAVTRCWASRCILMGCFSGVRLSLGGRFGVDGVGDWLAGGQADDVAGLVGQLVVVDLDADGGGFVVADCGLGGAQSH